VTIIEKFNGQSITGSSAALQVRFADSPAQKKLKHQTARKRLFKTSSPREFQSMAAALGQQDPYPFQQPTLPVTPETMLGFNTSQQQQQPVDPSDEDGLVADVEQKCSVGNDLALVSSA
jgi:hypothetical protein